MLWHNGDVYDAVNKVKELQKYLFVSIRDTDTPKNYINILETSERLHNILKNSVCLNLLKDSNEYMQFSSVYKVEQIPSIYVITHQGELITIINNVEEQNIYNELTSVFGIQTEESVSTIPPECIPIPASTDNTEQAAMEETMSHEEKMAEVRRLLAEKHKQRAEEEKRKAIEDELKCREQGRQLNQLKRAQKEREDQELKDELKRTRNAEKQARERILRQIEDDKLERKQRFANQSTVKSPEVIEDQQVVQRSVANNSGVRLLFRFPDGSSTNHKFHADDKFSVVRAFVATHVQKNMGHFKGFEIRKFFPTETITAENDSSTLSDLNLVPSASFAVLFLASPKVSNQSVSLMAWVLAPINFVLLTLSSILHWITSRFTGAAPSTPTQNAASSSYSTWEERQKRLAAAQSRTIKKDGNVAGFSDAPRKDDDDEDEARWNGNSTQQM